MKRVPWLDAMRIIGSFLVIFSHYIIQADITFLSSSHVLLKKMLRTLFINEGVVGVSLLFLVSGYLFAYAMDKKKKGFLFRRFLKIYPTYIMVLIIYLILQVSTGLNLSLGVYVSHALMIPDIMGYYMIDPVLWTLWVQVHFYLIYYFLFLRNTITEWRLNVINILILVSLILVNLTSLFPFQGNFGGLKNILSFNGIYLIFISLGIVIYQYSENKWSTYKSIRTGLITITMFFISLYTGETFGMRNEILISFFVGLLITSFIFKIRYLFQTNSYIVYLSNATYPLYLLHYSLAISISPFLLKLNIFYPWSLIIVGTILIIIVVFLMRLKKRIDVLKAIKK